MVRTAELMVQGDDLQWWHRTDDDQHRPSQLGGGRWITKDDVKH